MTRCFASTTLALVLSLLAQIPYAAYGQSSQADWVCPYMTQRESQVASDYLHDDDTAYRAGAIVLPAPAATLDVPAVEVTLHECIPCPGSACEVAEQETQSGPELRVAMKLDRMHDSLADCGHSTGLELAYQINLENEGLSGSSQVKTSHIVAYVEVSRGVAEQCVDMILDLAELRQESLVTLADTLVDVLPCRLAGHNEIFDVFGWDDCQECPVYVTNCGPSHVSSCEAETVECKDACQDDLAAEIEIEVLDTIVFFGCDEPLVGCHQVTVPVISLDAPADLAGSQADAGCELDCDPCCEWDDCLECETSPCEYEAVDACDDCVECPRYSYDCLGECYPCDECHRDCEAYDACAEECVDTCNWDCQALDVCADESDTCHWDCQALDECEDPCHDSCNLDICDELYECELECLYDELCEQCDEECEVYDACEDECELNDACEDECEVCEEGDTCLEDCDDSDLEINQCEQEDHHDDYEMDYYHHDHHHPAACTRCPYYSHP